MRLALALCVPAFLLGCSSSSDSPSPDLDASQQSEAGDESPAVDAPLTDDALAEAEPAQDAAPDASPIDCNSANRPLPSNLSQLGWDDSTPVGNLRTQTWSVTANNHSYTLNAQTVYEAVRFDLEHPAKIYGFAIQWQGIPEGADPQLPLIAGLYPDFGYNGFDFWRPQPYFEGARCALDQQPGQWLTYVLPEPVELKHPGLVYVAHQATPTSGPVFGFDGTPQGDGKCTLWDDCHSSMNLPQAEASTFYNGLSFPFQYDYMVRLYYEYTEQLPAAQRIFQPEELPPMGHVAFGDYDNDGWDDLITDGPTLFHNNGDGTFSDATASSGLAAMSLGTSGGVWGDYDNDGCLDLFLYAESTTVPDALLHSQCNGTFTNATASAGIVDEQSYNNCGGDPANLRSPSSSAAFVDLDADGLLDLYIANFICWSQESYYSDTVYHNLGNGSFELWTSGHGFSSLRTASRGVSPIDQDGDGDMDVLVNNYRLQANLFFDNNGDGTVTEKAKALKLAGTRHSPNYYGHTIGVAWGDLDNDGDFDLIEANLAHPRFYNISDKTEVLMHQPDGTYQDISGDWSTPHSAAGLRYQETHSVPALADFNHDGNLDLVITAVYDGRPTDFYWGKGDGTFQLDAYHAGITTENGWGVAVSDFDNDGDPDLFAHRPFRNTLPAAQKGHWLQVRVIGNVASNWDALGATVRVQASGKTLLRYVQGGSGQGNQDSQYLHFGLGTLSQVDSVEVTFPGGHQVSFSGPFAADQRLWLYEDGTHTAGWAPTHR